MLKYKRSITVNGLKLDFSYSKISGRLSASHENNNLCSKLLWLPRQNIEFTFNENVYHLKISLFPIKKITLLQGNEMICENIFPEQTRYSIIRLTFLLMRKCALGLAFISG